MNILYIEDDLHLSKIIKTKLNKYSVDVAGAGKEGLKRFRNKEYDLLIIDYYLPDTDGISICKKVRESDKKVAILLFTTNENKEIIVEALDVGADDYLTKPFIFAELEARIRALFRRTEDLKKGKCIRVGNLVLDLSKHCIFWNEQIIKLSHQEYLLLRYMIINRDKLVSREELYSYVWKDKNFYNSNTIDVHIKRIRKKLQNFTKDKFIKSMYGLGYRFEESV
ncbi:MAG: response regulator transcription factor [Candidatus Shapirobacteria bacterium]|nr:response regulator transcription factor [Candidatus Shapirobacteria bacterium]